MLKIAILGLALLATGKAYADDDAASAATSRIGRAYFGFGAGGGTITSATLLDRKADRSGATGYAAGVGEIYCGFYLTEGLSLGLSGQSFEFAPLGNDAVERGPAWSGGAGGLLLKAEHRRIFLRTGVMAGSIEAKQLESSQEDRHRTNREGFVGGRAELGITLVRTNALDVTLAGGVQPLLLDRSPDARLERRLYFSRASLELSFHPDSWGETPRGYYSWHCYGCGNAFFYTGKALVEVGAYLGRATANGLFRVLVR